MYAIINIIICTWLNIIQSLNTAYKHKTQYQFYSIAIEKVAVIQYISYLFIYLFIMYLFTYYLFINLFICLFVCLIIFIYFWGVWVRAEHIIYVRQFLWICANTSVLLDFNLLLEHIFPVTVLGSPTMNIGMDFFSCLGYRQCPLTYPPPSLYLKKWYWWQISWMNMIKLKIKLLCI